MNFDPNEAKLLMDILPLKIRQNLLNPSSRAVGDGLGGIFSTILYPFIKLNIYNKGKLKAYANKVATNVIKIPFKDRSTKRLDTTLKIMSNSRYCLNSDTLQSWFAKLLASSVDSRVNGAVSNYFPTVLSNMNTASATFLTKFRNEDQFPIGNLQVLVNNKGAIIPLKNNIIDWNWKTPSNVFMFMSCNKEINLLSSFNIINVTFDSWLSGEKADHAYNTIKNCRSVKGKVKVGKSIKDVKIEKGVISLTPLGKEFVRVTMPD